MQILGKKNRILLISIAIAMLTALGFSFALWDTSAVKAASGDTSVYANAMVGDIVTFGKYFQTANSAEKTPIEWIVVDKDERSGQLTLMSKYILAYGSYFGNYYYNKNADGTSSWVSSYIDAAGNTIDMNDLVGGVPYNQAWAESTARAYLNNLERFDLGGDIFNATHGISTTREPSKVFTLIDSENQIMRVGDLKASIGFSNARYWTGLNNKTDIAVQNLVKNNPEFMSRHDDNNENSYEVYYKRSKITNPIDRLARNGFLDEAFSDEEKSMIVPRNIPGAISHRWPDNEHYMSQTEYVEGTTDRVWLPSAEELNIKAGKDWAGSENDSWTTPSDLSSSEAFEYFKNYTNPNELTSALKTIHTAFAGQGSGLGNFSIPSYVPSSQIGDNTSNAYWTRSPSSYWYKCVRTVGVSGVFYADNTYYSRLGVRPCVIMKY